MKVLLGVLLSLLVAELGDWAPWLAERTVLRAARRLPPEIHDRLVAEWLAELDSIPGKRSKLLWSLTTIVSSRASCRAALGLPPWHTAVSLRARQSLSHLATSLRLRRTIQLLVPLTFGLAIGSLSSWTEAAVFLLWFGSLTGLAYGSTAKRQGRSENIPKKP